MKNGKFSKLIISFVIVLNIIFTISVIVVFIKTSQEPTTLTVSWFSFTTVELWNLAKIKQEKEKNKREDIHD